MIIWLGLLAPTGVDAIENLTRPILLKQSGRAFVAPGDALNLFVEVQGAAPLSYEWRLNGVVLPNETGARLSVSAVGIEHVGNYQVRVSNEFGQLVSNVMAVNINPLPEETFATVWAQPFEWVNPGPNLPHDITADAEANVYVVGQVTDAKGFENFLTAKYSPAGKLMWSMTEDFADGGKDVAVAGAVDGNGDIVVAGTSFFSAPRLKLPDSGWGDMVAVKYHADGKQLWVKRFQGAIESDDRTVDLSVDSNGNVVMVGNVFSGRTPNVLTVKYSGNGELLWPMGFDGGGGDSVAAVAADSRGDVVLAMTSQNDTGVDDVVTLKYDLNGKELWSRRLDGPGGGPDGAREVLIDAENHIYVGGSFTGKDTRSDFGVVKYDPSGRELWFRTVTSPEINNDILSAMTEAPGGVALGGVVRHANRGDETFVVRLGADGKVLWAKHRPASFLAGDLLNDIGVDRAENVYLGGAVFSEKTNLDFMTSRLDPAGSPVWNASFDGADHGNDGIFAMVVDPTDAIVVTGASEVTSQVAVQEESRLSEIVTIRYQNVQGLQNQPPVVLIVNPEDGAVLVEGSRLGILAQASDRDGRVERVEFYLGNQKIGEVKEAPYGLLTTAGSPGTYVLTAKAIDDRGAVVTSPSVRVRVIAVSDDSPTFLKSPLEQLVRPGEAVTLTAELEGEGPFKYQWFLNGQLIKGATDSDLVLSDFGLDQSGRYTVVVVTPDGVVRTQPASITEEAPVALPGDDVTDAVLIEGESGRIKSTNAGATREISEPIHAEKRGQKTIWFRWTAPVSGLATFHTKGSAVDTLLGVYVGSRIGDLTEVVSDDDEGGFSTSEVRFSAIEGQTYLIAVAGYNQQGGIILLSWNVNQDVLASLPNVFIRPRRQSVPFGGQAGFQADTGGIVPDLTYQWFHNGEAIPDEVQERLLIDPVVGRDAGLYRVLVSSGNTTVLSHKAKLEVLRSRFAAIVQATRTRDKFADLFYLLVDQLIVQDPGVAPQAQVAPMSASVVTGFSGAQIFNTFGATKEEGEPDHCGIVGGASQWFAYQAPAGGTVVIDTDGSDFDTVLAVYTGSGSDFSDLVEVVCDNDGGADGQDSSVTFEATQDTIYFVAVDGVDGATGEVNLNYNLQVLLQIQDIEIAFSGEFQFRINSVPDLSFTVAASDDLVEWTELLTTSSPEGSYLFQDNQSLVAPWRYYQVYYSEVEGNPEL